MNERIKELAEQSNITVRGYYDETGSTPAELQRFAELIVKECIDKIETYRIPVGNSCSGELAAEWTYEALETIRDDIKEHFFGTENEQQDQVSDVHDQLVKSVDIIEDR